MDAKIEAVADAIDAARYAHPEHPRERPRPFAEADASDREYALRLARAAYAALPAQGEIARVREALEDADEMLSQVRGIPTECVERDASRTKAPCNAVWCVEYDDCMVARAERRRAALSTPQAWRPIETAPKSGRGFEGRDGPDLWLWAAGWELPCIGCWIGKSVVHNGRGVWMIVGGREVEPTHYKLDPYLSPPHPASVSRGNVEEEEK